MLGWLAAVGGLASGAYLGIALLLVALGGPARKFTAPHSAGMAEECETDAEVGQGYLDFASVTDDAVILQAGEESPRLLLAQLAKYLSRFGIARVYVPVAGNSAPLSREGLAALDRQIRADGKPAPVALLTRSQGGALAYRFLGGRYGQHEAVPRLQRFVARDGAALAFRRIPADSETAVIFLHGAGSHGLPYAAPAYFLAQNDLAQVYLLNLRGHDQSGPRGDVDFAGRHEDDLADLIAHVRNVTPGARVVVAGHSLGGGLALRFASGPHGHLADAFLLLAPYLGPMTPIDRLGPVADWAELGVAAGRRADHDECRRPADAESSPRRRFQPQVDHSRWPGDPGLLASHAPRPFAPAELRGATSARFASRFSCSSATRTRSFDRAESPR